MKYQEKIIIIKLSEGDEQSILKFHELPANHYYELMAMNKEGRVDSGAVWQKRIFEQCFAIENLFVNDRMISVADLQAGLIPQGLCNILISAYSEAAKQGAEEKKG
jgi:hypothetical protein